MELFHTSPTEITAIDQHGRFGEFLFFADSEYVTTAGTHVTYKIEVADSDIIEASSLFFHQGAEKLEGLVTQLAERFDVSESDAEKLIDESISIYDLDCNVEAEDLAEASWDIQLATARAAKILGYRGVVVSDEQGAAYMIDLLNREAELFRL